MRLEDFVEVLLFPDVGMEEFGSLSTDEFNPIDGFFRGVEKVVCDDHFVVCFKKGKGSERANVACASSIESVQMMMLSL